MSAPADDEILIRREGRAGRITLNRPKALNALTYPMIVRMWDTLKDWACDPAIELVLLDGRGDRGLCAGGDVRTLYDSRVDGPAFARRFWADEYHLNTLIKRYPKPYVALQDGIVMGGGIGVSSHGSHRIVTERSRLAMPETTIGLIPDVGGTWLLGQAPGCAGLYLGLSGEPLKAADAIYAGFSDAFVQSARLPELITRLCDPAAGGVDEVIAPFAGDAGPSNVASLAPQITAAFDKPDVPAVLATLAATPGDWAERTRAMLQGKSPKALALTFAAVQQARSLGSLEEALEIEYRLVCRLFEDGEFLEGVRALIVDKDRKPKWNPPNLASLPDTLIADYLAPLERDRELMLRKA